MRLLPATRALLLIGVGTAAACRQDAEPVSHSQAVRVKAVERATLTDWLELAGRVVPPPDREASVAPLIAGRLLAVKVLEGDTVRAGQVLALVEPENLEDTVTAAEAALARASADAEFRRAVARRSEELLKKGVVARQDVESDSAAAAAAEATRSEAASSLATARRQRSWASLVAPFEGVVVKVLRRAGDDVDGTPATPVVELAGDRDWEIAADATAGALSRLQPGQAGTIESAPDAPERPARVTRVARALDPTTGTGVVRLHPDGPGPELPLGAAVRVRVALQRRERTLAVPSSALRRNEAGGSEVVVVEAGHARVRAVTTGVIDGSRVEILSGVTEAESVVVEDPVALSDGAEVRGVVEPADSGR